MQRIYDIGQAQHLFCVGSVNLDYYNIMNFPKQYIGGSAANTCYYLTHLLPESHFHIYLVALLGSDHRADILTQLLNTQKIDASFVRRWPGSTGMTQIDLDAHGERSISRYPSVNDELFGYLQQPEMKEILSFQKIHVKASVLVVAALLQCQPRFLSCDIAGWLTPHFEEQQKTMSLIQQTRSSQPFDLLFGTTEEFVQLLSYWNSTQIFDNVEDISMNISNPLNFILPRVLLLIQQKFVRGVIIKDGAKGATFVSEKDIIQSEAMPVKVVDTTGAGDGFNAGFLASYFFGHNVRYCLKYACGLGSMICTEYGAQSLKITPKIISTLDNFAKL